jgi:tetratricopeptide (TPR) repeat protein
MLVRDFRGDPITGANTSALEVFEQALADFRSWRGDPARSVTTALEEAPRFVMAHVLRAYLFLCTRDPASVRSAAPVYATAAGLPANRRERLHLAAISATLRDDYESAKSILGDLLAEHPRDLLALQVAHAFDYLTGDLARLEDRVPRILSAWTPTLPGYHAVLAMHAFGLVECGEHERAEAVGLEALALDPLDARAHHALAHVFEMAERPDDGLRWMGQRAAGWDGDTTVAKHCWWHLALFHLQRGADDEALAIYDGRIRTGNSQPVADLIDASSLLWRVSLQDADAGGRWADLASDWAPRIADGYCTFTDLHAMMAFVGARNWDLAMRLVRELRERQFTPNRHGSTTRLVGVPACRALLAFGQGDHAEAIRLLGGLPPLAHRLGGSHAQRDVLHLTLRAAMERSRGRITLHRSAASPVLRHAVA